jgi:uncharacterized membrane protein YphA (DoxX/SURF4 family)
VFSPFIFWPWFTGLVFLVIGVFFTRRELAAARALEKLVVLGPVFFGASLATFGAEHLAGARFIMQAVPSWMPARLFWAYFVGFALIATAISFVISKYVPLSAVMVGVMIFLFVLILHVPRVVANPRDRISWAVALRDLAFASGAWALAGSELRAKYSTNASLLILIGRLVVAIAVIFFGIEHFLHPQFAPGVPLEKLTPAWFPVPALWAFLTGIVLFVGGIALLINRHARLAAIWIGLVMTLLTVLLYLPILATAKRASEMNEGTNYVADTLLFAGTALLLARAIPSEPSPSARVAKRRG